ncbi:MAG: methylated-DNA--[protein]-cysteine S-methyltransferase [Planctomycetota bacterium]
MHVHLQRVRVPLFGQIEIAATAHGLVAVKLNGDVEAVKQEVTARFPDALFKRGNALTADAASVIRRYLSGGPDPHVPVVLPEQGFSARVWREIARIPRGKVISYGRLARKLRKPQAARAVGQACGRNPVPLVVPCHRVVASDGSLGGFGAGVAVKRKLLELEGVTIR